MNMDYEDLRPHVDDEGYFRGAEMLWNIEDVETIAHEEGYELTQEDLKRVLIASFADNEWLMGEIRSAIETTMDWMIRQGELKPKRAERMETTEEIIFYCANAIMAGSEEFGWIDKHGFNYIETLPTPQRSGTQTQQRTYANMKAREIVEQYIQNR